LDAKRQTAVMVIDLDRFKIMNDYLGHGSGDRLLVTIADRIRTSIRSNDFAARLGGDEFVFIVDKAKSEMEILATAYRMLDVIAQPVAIAGQEVTHTASIGIAMAEPGEQSGLDLLGWADVAMYAAKARGRNQAVVFDRDLREEVNDRSRTELMLREAIEMGGLRLHFQPEVDLRTGKVLAAEALVRWEHPTRGLLAASEFITVAEETGLVTELGRWVFAEACRQLAIWQNEYKDLPFIVRVNMSPADFKMGDLVEFVERCLRENNVPGNRLCIEITEYAVLDEPERIAKILKSFQSLGLEIALDDFGTGFASMTGLKNLPVNLLKLDMSFVRGINTDNYDRAIVESIIRLGAALNLGVIAEGIESDSIIQKLLELGCYRGQGYLISRPVPAAELSEMLREGAVAASILRSVETTPVELADLQL
jgi:diguanylate cyclase (GGDEF)-like protein